MKKHIVITVLILTVFLISCASFKKEFIKKGNLDDAVQNAILDFSNTTSLFKNDSVFSVWPQDTLYRMVLNKDKEDNYKFIEGEHYKEIIAVGITANYDKILITDNTSIGVIGKLPSQYLEKDGKLFYWWDNNKPLTQEILDVLSKYGLLQDDEGGWVKFPDATINDLQKGAHYYFCRNDLTNYKKVITNKGIGYYDMPKINCNLN